ncbi:hypothetical protein F4777DRAFT_558273 [Nemania sp. FL0916]|nr:hypothetical protein F4777DRAFT_558273 [Nemania sp. FL0916]
MTGYFRDGYCRTAENANANPTTFPPSNPNSNPFGTGNGVFGRSAVIMDPGNHAIAGVVTDEFLDFSASRGNDLRAIGLVGGCRWCLCTERWLEAYRAYRSGKVTNLGVPRVDLDATEDSALATVGIEALRQFAVQHGPPPGSGPSAALGLNGRGGGMGRNGL